MELEPEQTESRQKYGHHACAGPASVLTQGVRSHHKWTAGTMLLVLNSTTQEWCFSADPVAATADRATAGGG